MRSISLSLDKVPRLVKLKKSKTMSLAPGFKWHGPDHNLMVDGCQRRSDEGTHPEDPLHNLSQPSTR